MMITFRFALAIAFMYYTARQQKVGNLNILFPNIGWHKIALKEGAIFADVSTGGIYMSDTGFADKIKNGTVEIKKGKVFVTNPSPGGKCAVILPSDQVDIYVDGKLIKEKTAVSAENNIKILGK